MIVQRDCRECDGSGRVHNDGHTGDPMDKGKDCPACDGLGVVDVELDEDGDEI